jgi:predicted DNA-binding protein (UPF0251 family)
MPRRKKRRMVSAPPVYSSFKPIGVRRNEIHRLSLDLDEFEAIRLADYMSMDHSEASDEMEISRSTFSRLIETARKKIAQFIIEGKELYIKGGNIHFRGNLIRCNECGNMFSIEIGENMLICPTCKSENLLNLAGGYGHGRCCANRK